MNWGKVTADHVVEAIRRYNEHPERYTKARHTFLVYDGKQYPAKAIRGIAYEVCFGEPVSQEAFTGGRDTARFFRGLQFTVVTGSDAPVQPSDDGEDQPPTPPKPRRLDKVTQKNALQRLLQKRFGIVISEKAFEWLRVPHAETFDDLYTRLFVALREYRGHEGFIQPGRRLTVDFHVEALNLVIEYDEDQHFSKARQLALENYPDDLPLGFSVAEWRDTCAQVRAADGNPPSRDETRALYDAVRDIEVPRHGIRLLRIRHGMTDWEGPDAEDALMEMLRPYLPTEEVASVTSAKAGSTPDGRTAWRELEIEFQRIRLNYLKWFFHFTPPECEVIPGCGSGDDFRLLESAYGRSFTVFPCGNGSVYVGAGKGCVRLPRECFSHTLQLDQETACLKESLRQRTQAVKAETVRLLDDGNLEGAWRVLFEYWWLKLGAHEYAHDVAYEVRPDSERIPGGNLRDYLLTAMYRSVAPDALDKARFGAADIRHFLRHGMQWNRFACCAFDCGPILVGKARHIPYEELAAARRTFFDGRDLNGATLQVKRTLARAALDPLVDFLALYYEEPFSLVQRFRGFREHRDALRAMIHDTQRVLNDLIEREQLALPQMNYLPE